METNLLNKGKYYTTALFSMLIQNQLENSQK